MMGGSSVVRPVSGRLIALAMTSPPARGYRRIYENAAVMPRRGALNRLGRAVEARRHRGIYDTVVGDL